MNIHDESNYAKCAPFEAEMRRKLWWSVVMFDHRICEMSDYKDTTLAPPWDCRTPLNVNDLEFRPEMKTSSASHAKPTESHFAVVRSELADFVRHSAFHKNFINPSLNTIAQPKVTWYGPLLEGDQLMALERMIEGKYLAFCYADSPLHFMTIWAKRGYLARTVYWNTIRDNRPMYIQPTEVQGNAAISYALSMLECDTKLRTSPLTKVYRWLLDFHVPAVAFDHILNSLRKRPTEDYAERAWDAMSNNYEARTILPNIVKQNNVVFFTQIVLQALEKREALLRQQKKPLEPPQIVTDMRNRARRLSSNFPQQSNGEQPNGAMGINIDQSRMPPMGFECFTGHGPGGYLDMPGLAMMDADMDQFWPPIDWALSHAQGGW